MFLPAAAETEPLTAAGVALPLLQQSIMFWQLSLSTIFLGKRFAKVQLLGAATVVAGVCFAAWPQQGGSGLLQEVSWTASVACKALFSTPQSSP